MKNIIYIVVLVLLQALIFNRIHLFGVAMPLVYIYYVLRIPRDAKPWISMVMSFVLGVSIDTFSNTPGLAAASLTLLAFIRPWVLELYLRREDPEDFIPTMHGMGFLRYFFYILPLILIYCVTLYTLEVFTFTHWYEWLMNVAGSVVITMILILTAESVRK